MTNLQNNFNANAMESHTDPRISAKDARFCQLHQEAYDKVRAKLSALATQIEEMESEQTEILSPVTDQFSVPYLTEKWETSLDVLYKELDRTHNVFICNISYHFKYHYHIPIDEMSIKKALLPAKSTIRNKEEYTRQLRCLSLRYEDILEQIFTQMDGCSLQDKAMQTLKKATHKAAWYPDGSKSLSLQYEILW